MSDINICTFTGRLGADPELKTFQSGGRICNMRMAVGSSWKDRESGERRERTEWVSVVIQNDGLIGIAERFLRKGSRIAISGEQRTRKWQSQDGSDRYSTEIVLTSFGGTLTMLDSKPDGEGQGGQRQQRGNDRVGQRTEGDWGKQQGDKEVYSSERGGWQDGGSGWGGDDLDDDIAF